MAKIHYISPSFVPSRTANSVHVMHQCNGLKKIGFDVTLYVKRTVSDKSHLQGVLLEHYGVDVSDWKVVSFFSNSMRAVSLRIALIALPKIIISSRHDIVLTRNLYAAFLLSLFRRKILFETHQLEYGVRKFIQKVIMKCSSVRVVVISQCLAHYLEQHHSMNLREPVILHDAAPDGILRIDPQKRRRSFLDASDLSYHMKRNWNAVCGYFGQLYAGRGVEIIEEMASARSNCLFVVYGGSREDVEKRHVTAPSNLIFMGHVAHPVARKIQASVDVLLMPYQVNVSIGVAGHDTARWMSPMKMFEYLASGVPIISSDLPVLREVLIHGDNALLVSPDNVVEWLDALDKLLDEPDTAAKIGENAHDLYQRKYTWSRRAAALVDAYEAIK